MSFRSKTLKGTDGILANHRTLGGENPHTAWLSWDSWSKINRELQPIESMFLERTQLSMSGMKNFNSFNKVVISLSVLFSAVLS